MAPVTVAALEQAESTTRFLRALPLLAGLPEEVLAELTANARRVRVNAGQKVMEEGSPGDGLYVLVDGELEVTRRCADQDIVLSVVDPGAFLGEMSLVEDGPRTASVRAVVDSELLVIEPTDFRMLLQRSPAASMTLLRTVMARLRSTESALIQHAKLASLGTLAAGLAHELNNPASALSRGLPHLRSALDEVERCAGWVGRLGLRETLEARLDLEANSPSGTPPARLRTHELIDLENRLLDWLAARGVTHPVRVAPPLLSAGWTPERLQDLVDGLEDRHADPVLQWLAARCSVSSIMDELTHSTAAIADVVAAVRTHASLGQPSIRMQDIVEGLESSLVILRSRLSSGISVTRDFAPDLPLVEAFGAELNQVWTNLIENAIDAMNARGTLLLRTRSEGNRVTVEISDDGSGIPTDVQPHIFDPFFTTKPPGSGTGLGLHISYTIVRRHRGSIRVESRPGQTRFTVELPLRLTDAA